MIISRRNGCIVINEDRVFKYFASKEEYLKEKALLKQDIFSSTYDEKSGYKLNFVNIIHFDESFYIMKKIDGISLNNLIHSNPEDFYYAGLWLKNFHSQNRQNDEISRLYGDANPSHFFINKEEKIVTAIDPGLPYGKIDNIYIDLARFTIDTMKNIKIIRKKCYVLAINKFLKGYFNNNKIKYDQYIKYVEKRMQINYNKQRTLKNIIFALISLSLIKYRLKILNKHLSSF